MARLKEYKREMAYRTYVCDSLHLMGENKYITVRFSDVINPSPVETRTGEEIITHIKGKLKGLSSD